MNASTNIHRASTIKIKRKRSGGTTWTSIEIRGNDGSYYSLAIHDADPESPAKITGPDDAELRAAPATWQVKAVAVLTSMAEWMEDNMACQCEHGFICAECDLLSEAQALLRTAGTIEPSK